MSFPSHVIFTCKFCGGYKTFLLAQDYECPSCGRVACIKDILNSHDNRNSPVKEDFFAIHVNGVLKEAGATKGRPKAWFADLEKSYGVGARLTFTSYLRFH